MDADRLAWIVSTSVTTVSSDMARVGIALILLAAGVAKILVLERFRQAVAALTGFPLIVSVAIAVVVPLVEMAVGLLLVFNYATGVAAITASVMFTMFAVVIGRKLLPANASASCNCFGAQMRLTRSTILRNFGLAVLSLGAFESTGAGVLVVVGLLAFMSGAASEAAARIRKAQSLKNRALVRAA